VSQTIIRRANLSDQETICAFNMALALETEGQELDSSSVSRGVGQVLEDPDKGFYLLALHQTPSGDQQICGQLLCLSEWSDWQNGSYWWIQSVYVAPQFRRQGVFRTLFESLTKMSRGLAGIVGIRLYVDKSNAVGLKTYAQLGFVRSSYEIYQLQ
jgi:ribosomal protein S18 acetylase RimI-like enzyme